MCVFVVFLCVCVFFFHTKNLMGRKLTPMQGVTCFFFIYPCCETKLVAVTTTHASCLINLPSLLVQWTLSWAIQPFFFFSISNHQPCLSEHSVQINGGVHRTLCCKAFTTQPFTTSIETIQRLFLMNPKISSCCHLVTCRAYAMLYVGTMPHSSSHTHCISNWKSNWGELCQS